MTQREGGSMTKESVHRLLAEQGIEITRCRKCRKANIDANDIDMLVSTSELYTYIADKLSYYSVVCPEFHSILCIVESQLNKIEVHIRQRIGLSESRGAKKKCSC